MTSQDTRISTGAAVALGHLFVTLPVLAIIVLVALGGTWWVHLDWRLAAAIGALVAWPWWSVTVPRWRHWALARGADPQRLQELAQSTYLVWRRGSVFE